MLTALSSDLENMNNELSESIDEIVYSLDKISEGGDLTNLINIEKGYNQYGVTISKNPDGTYTFNGTQRGTYDMPIATLPAETYTALYEVVGGELPDQLPTNVSIRANGARWVNASVNKQTNTYDSETPVFLRINNGTVLAEYTIKIIIQKGVDIVSGREKTAVDTIARQNATGGKRKLKVACVGDSLTEGVDGGDSTNPIHIIRENYPYFLQKILECEVLNYGRHGASAKTYYSDYKAAYTFDNSIDIVLICLGTNGGVGVQNGDTIEFACGASMDYHDYNTELQIGAYCALIEWIMEQTNNKSQIILITPPYNECDSSRTKTALGSVEGIKEVGKRYKLPIIDACYESGINHWNTAYFHPHDGLHFNAKGYHKLGSFIGNKVKSFVSWFDNDDSYDDELA